MPLSCLMAVRGNGWQTIQVESQKHCTTQTHSVLTTCFGQLPGTPGTGCAVPPGQYRDAPKARCLGHGGLEIAVGAVRVCAAPGPLVVQPPEFVLRAALPTPRCSPRAISVAPVSRPSERCTGTASPSVSSMDTESDFYWKSHLCETLPVCSFH